MNGSQGLQEREGVTSQGAAQESFLGGRVMKLFSIRIAM